MRSASWTLLMALCAAGCTKIIPAPESTGEPPAAGEQAAAPTRPKVYIATPSQAPVARPTVTPPTPVDALKAINTLNGDPNGLKREDLNNAMQAVIPSLASCFEAAAPPSVTLAFDADPSGAVQNVKVTGASPTAETCVTRSLTAMRLPVFQGKLVPVTFPLTIYQRPQPAPPPPVAARPAPPPSAPMPGTTAEILAPPPPTNAPVNTGSTRPYEPPPTTSLPTTTPSGGTNSKPTQIQTFIQP